MEATHMNPIKAQDEYIEVVSKLDPSKNCYYAHVSRQRNKAISAIMDFGFTLPQADALVTEAHDVAQHHRFVRSIA
jgi:hypothetical protein